MKERTLTESVDACHAPNQTELGVGVFLRSRNLAGEEHEQISTAVECPGELVADAARRKEQLINEALERVRKADSIDERETLSPDLWEAWYDRVMPTVGNRDYRWGDVP
jgi:hypothetical protein